VTPVEPIEVACVPAGDGWVCTVRVGRDRPTTHAVRVTTDDLARLAPGADDPDDLVRRSFEFLLDRERKESILGSFDLPVIGRYFPEYERTIRRTTT
jgi:hypothetical protein